MSRYAEEKAFKAIKSYYGARERAYECRELKSVLQRLIEEEIRSVVVDGLPAVYLSVYIDYNFYAHGEDHRWYNGCICVATPTVANVRGTTLFKPCFGACEAYFSYEEGCALWGCGSEIHALSIAGDTLKFGAWLHHNEFRNFNKARWDELDQLEADIKMAYYGWMKAHHKMLLKTPA
ncbi:MAG: hypothetical protein ACK5MU_03845 [Candidatus Saccharimonadales bacterium]